MVIYKTFIIRQIALWYNNNIMALWSKLHAIKTLKLILFTYCCIYFLWHNLLIIRKILKFNVEQQLYYTIIVIIMQCNNIEK